LRRERPAIFSHLGCLLAAAVIVIVFDMGMMSARWSQSRSRGREYQTRQLLRSMAAALQCIHSQNALTNDISAAARNDVRSFLREHLRQGQRRRWAVVGPFARADVTLAYREYSELQQVTDQIPLIWNAKPECDSVATVMLDGTMQVVPISAWHALGPENRKTKTVRIRLD